MSGPVHTTLAADDLRRLIGVGRSLASELDIDVVLERVLEVARELTGAQYAAIGVLATDAEALERFITAGIDAETQRRIGPLPRGRGVLGVLIRHPEPLRLADVGRHPESYGFPEGHPPMSTFLGVPIVIRGKVYGNLYLTEKDGGAQFTDEDEGAVRILADWAALAVDNARAYASEQTRRTELERAVASLEATSDITRAIGGETDLDRVLELIVKRARALVEARTVLILLLSEDAEALIVAAMAGEGDRELLGAEIPVADSLTGTAVLTGRPQRLSDGSAQFRHALAERLDPHSGLIMPLRYKAQVLGVLCAFDPFGTDAFTEEHELLLSSFAASAAISVATAKRVSEQGLRRSIEASERERSRWARELHDETLQELAGLKVLLAGSRGDPSSVDQAVEQIEMSITGLRRLITELRPAALDEYGLGAAIEALVQRVTTTSGIDVTADVALAFDAGLVPTRLAADIESTAYRLIQEAVTNAVKHSSADHVWVRAQEGETELVVEVRDDGRGFDPSERSAGFGLLGMRERVELAGGSLENSSSPGHGTTIRAQLPGRHAER
jgi:Signal transduction histidine kinase